MFQKERCFRRLQIECYFLPITFADLFSPAAHICKLHDSRHNFLPLTIPPPHPMPFPDQETPVIPPVISPALWWAGKGEMREAVGVWGLPWSGKQCKPCYYSGLGAVETGVLQAAGTQVRALLKHLWRASISEFPGGTIVIELAP